MKAAFVFPGQGSQYVGMGKEICEHFPRAKELFSQASDAIGIDLMRLCFYGPPEELNKTFRTQPCILTTSMAIYSVITEKQIYPSVVSGHSLGEYSALVAAGSIRFTDAVQIAEKRGLLMQEAVPEGTGLMAAVLGIGRERVSDICLSVRSGYVAPANYNCPGQVVIAGEREAVMEAIEMCKTAGAKRAVPLTVSVPSHCRLMDGASQRLADLLDRISFSDPSIPVVSNADARFLTERTGIKGSLVRQLGNPLLWEDSIRNIIGSGVTLFLELGPGKVLSGLIKRIDSSVTVLHVEDLNSLEKTLSALSGSKHPVE
jgi:[acyl-carrier-protein] S-malonyltransferase